MITWFARRVDDDSYVQILYRGSEHHLEIRTTPMSYAQLKQSAQEKANEADRIVDLEITWLNGAVTSIFIPPLRP